MAQKRRTLSALSDAGQDVMVLLNSPAAAQRIETDTDQLTQRWDNLVQKLEDCSSQVRYTSLLSVLLHVSLLYNIDSKCLFCFQVTEAVSVTGMSQIQERFVMETVTTVTTRMEQTFTSSDRELPPPAPPKRRHLDTDGELRRLYDKHKHASSLTKTLEIFFLTVPPGFHTITEFNVKSSKLHIIFSNLRFCLIYPGFRTRTHTHTHLYTRV